MRVLYTVDTMSTTIISGKIRTHKEGVVQVACGQNPLLYNVFSHTFGSGDIRDAASTIIQNL